MPFTALSGLLKYTSNALLYIGGVFDQLACQARRYQKSEMYSMCRFLGDDREYTTNFRNTALMKNH